MEIAIETLRIHAEARKNRMRGRGISVSKKEVNDGGLMYRALIDLIDTAMRINEGKQTRAAEYLNISPRSLNYHLQTYPELQKWCPKYNKVMRLAK